MLCHSVPMPAGKTKFRLGRVKNYHTIHLLQKACLLTQVRNPWTIIVCKHFISKGCICHLQCMYQVHLKKMCLQMRLFWLVVLESIEEEGCGLLNHVLGHEDVNDMFNVDRWAALVVHELGCKLGSLLRVRRHGMLKKSHVIRLEVDFLWVQNNLLQLAGFGEPCDNLIRYVGTQVNGESGCHVMGVNNITQLFSALQPRLSMSRPIWDP